MSLTDDMPLKRVELFADLKTACEFFDVIRENDIEAPELARILEAAARCLRNHPSHYRRAFIDVLARCIRYLENVT